MSCFVNEHGFVCTIPRKEMTRLGVEYLDSENETGIYQKGEDHLTLNIL